MGCNEASAIIRFPAVGLTPEVRKVLEDQYDIGFEDIQPKGHMDDEVCIDEGIFEYRASVCYGEFEELETVLREQGVPFDRETSMDYGVSPGDRIFRPSPDGNHFDRFFPADADGTIVVSVKNIRELLGDPDKPGPALAVREYLDREYPKYAPLSDFVPEIMIDKGIIKTASTMLGQVDMSRFPGLLEIKEKLGELGGE